MVHLTSLLVWRRNVGSKGDLWKPFFFFFGRFGKTLGAYELAPKKKVETLTFEFILRFGSIYIFLTKLYKILLNGVFCVKNTLKFSKV